MSVSQEMIVLLATDFDMWYAAGVSRNDYFLSKTTMRRKIGET